MEIFRVTEWGVETGGRSLHPTAATVGLSKLCSAKVWHLDRIEIPVKFVVAWYLGVPVLFRYAGVQRTGTRAGGATA